MHQHLRYGRVRLTGAPRVNTVMPGTLNPCSAGFRVKLLVGFDAIKKSFARLAAVYLRYLAFRGISEHSE